MFSLGFYCSVYSSFIYSFIVFILNFDLLDDNLFIKLMYPVAFFIDIFLLRWVKFLGSNFIQCVKRFQKPLW